MMHQVSQAPDTAHAPHERATLARRAVGPRRSTRRESGAKETPALIPQKLNVLRRPSELSLGQDPDLIARYLSGEDVTEQLAAIEHGELPVQRGDKKSTTQDKVAVRAVPERR